jgi:hypothetical protein
MAGPSSAKTRFALLLGHDDLRLGKFVFHAVFAAFDPGRDSTASRIENFWILLVAVIGNSSTTST